MNSFEDLANQPVEASMLARLSQRAVDYLEYHSPWRPFVTRVLLRNDLNRLDKSRFLGVTTGQAEPSQIIHGPSAFVQAYAIPLGPGTPTVPGDVVWSSNPVTATPHELLTQTVLSEEELSGAIPYDRIEAGKPIVERIAARPDSWQSDWLVEGLKFQENIEFVNGAATTADPWRGILNVAGISTFAAGSSPYIADIQRAIGKGRTARYRPNVAFVSTGLALVIANARATGGPLLDPAPPEDMWPEPLRAMDPNLIVGWLRNVPIVELDSLPNGASAASALVGDFSNVIVTHRVQPNGLLARLDESAHSDFVTDRYRYRLAESFDVSVAPNRQAAVYSITAINAPAP